MATLNEVFSGLSVKRRYEVWFLRVGLADGAGAWWFRYLLMNPGRGGCAGNPQGMPVQVWATWFPAGGKPQSFIQGYPLAGMDISRRGFSPFHLQIGDNIIEEDACRGSLNVNGHAITWNLRYGSAFAVTLSNKGWIGFSRTPHSDALVTGRITLDGQTFAGEPLGFGVQGHNCGYRHRNFWRWTHAYFPRREKRASTLEALVYEMPFGLIFRKAVLWHDGQKYLFGKLQESGISKEPFQWNFHCAARGGLRVEAAVDGRGTSVHRLPYIKTDCAGSFEVMNNSLASASLLLHTASGQPERLETTTGAVLEMAG